MNYEEFRKNFYVEVPELARITDAELADIHLSLDNMQVREKGPPKPQTHQDMDTSRNQHENPG